MRVFLSWSGNESKTMARELKTWLELVLPGVQPWMSDKDLGAGVRWSEEIEASLKSSNFGIICVTRNNKTSPWLNFEAGAISNNLSEQSKDKSRVVPYLLGVGFSDITGPLSQFHAKQADESGTWDLVQSLNKLSPNPRGNTPLEKTFKAFWGDLNTKIESLVIDLDKGSDIDDEGTGDIRSMADKMDEAITLLRGISISLPKTPMENLKKKTAPARLRNLAAKVSKDLREFSEILGVNYREGNSIEIVTVPMSEDRKDEIKLQAHLSMSNHSSNTVPINWVLLFEDGKLRDEGASIG